MKSCPCPNPPGGAIECRDDQLGICRVRNNQIEGACVDLPSRVRSALLSLPDRFHLVTKPESVPDAESIRRYLVYQLLGDLRPLPGDDLNELLHKFVLAWPSGKFSAEIGGSLLQFSIQAPGKLADGDMGHAQVALG